MEDDDITNWRTLGSVAASLVERIKRKRAAAPGVGESGAAARTSAQFPSGGSPEGGPSGRMDRGRKADAATAPLPHGAGPGVECRDDADAVICPPAVHG